MYCQFCAAEQYQLLLPEFEKNPDEAPLRCVSYQVRSLARASPCPASSLSNIPPLLRVVRRRDRARGCRGAAGSCRGSAAALTGEERVERQAKEYRAKTPNGRIQPVSEKPEEAPKVKRTGPIEEEEVDDDAPNPLVEFLAKVPFCGKDIANKIEAMLDAE